MVAAGEPTFWFNVPNFVRLLGAVILLVQCFTMFYTVGEEYAMYIIVMILALIMNAVLTLAVKKNSKRYLICYIMYMVMGVVVLFSTFTAEIWFWTYYKSLPNCNDPTITTPKPGILYCQNDKIVHQETVNFICTLVFSSISFCLDCLQLLLCWRYYKYLTKASSARDFHVSYYANEVNVPGAPPRYSPTTGETPANNATDPGPLPLKPPMYETLNVVELEENRQRTTSQPPCYQEQVAAPVTPENLLEL